MLRSLGEETPLDFLPDLNVVETWFLNAYRGLYGMRSNDYTISITDYKEYFSVFPLAFDAATTVDVIMTVDTECAVFRQELMDKKNNG